MICLFQLHPDLRLLHRHGYSDFSEAQLEKAVAKGVGMELEAQYIIHETQSQFEHAFDAIISEYGLTSLRDSILYICLVESESAFFELQHIANTFNSKMLAKELAQLLVCLRDTPESHEIALRLTTPTAAVKLTHRKLITWIEKMITEELSSGHFTYHDLGEEAFRLVSDGKTIKFGEPLNYDNLRDISTKFIRSPNRANKKLLIRWLYNVWKVVKSETPLTSPMNVTYTDRQMNFLFELAEIFGWLDRFSFEAEPKDYMHALFAYYTKS